MGKHKTGGNSGVYFSDFSSAFAMQVNTNNC